MIIITYYIILYYFVGTFYREFKFLINNFYKMCICISITILFLSIYYVDIFDYKFFFFAFSFAFLPTVPTILGWPPSFVLNFHFSRFSTSPMHTPTALISFSIVSNHLFFVFLFLISLQRSFL